MYEQGGYRKSSYYPLIQLKYSSTVIVAGLVYIFEGDFQLIINW